MCESITKKLKFYFDLNLIDKKTKAMLHYLQGRMGTGCQAVSENVMLDKSNLWMYTLSCFKDAMKIKEFLIGWVGLLKFRWSVIITR